LTESPFGFKIDINNELIENRNDSRDEGFYDNLKSRALASANKKTSKERNERYKETMEKDQLLVVSEGDTWFQYPTLKLFGINSSSVVKHGETITND